MVWMWSKVFRLLHFSFTCFFLSSSPFHGIILQKRAESHTKKRKIKWKSPVPHCWKDLWRCSANREIGLKYVFLGVFRIHIRSSIATLHKLLSSRIYLTHISRNENMGGNINSLFMLVVNLVVPWKYGWRTPKHCTETKTDFELKYKQITLDNINIVSALLVPRCLYIVVCRRNFPFIIYLCFAILAM